MRTGRLAITALRRRRVFAQTGLASEPALAHMTGCARSIGTDLSGESPAWRSYAKRVGQLDGQSRQMVRVRIGATIAGDAGRNHAGATGDRDASCACYGGWSVMNGRIDLGTFVAFASFSRYVDRPYPRTGIVFWLSLLAHRRR